MQFGWLNLTGALILALMMVPNLIFAGKNRGTEHLKNKCTCKPVLVLEQVGRYGSMALMVFPLLVWKFSFQSSAAFVLWTALCAVLLGTYFLCWGVYFRRPSLCAALWLAIAPSAIFILRGVFLRHWLLTAFGVVFACGHLCVTWCNAGGRDHDRT